MKNQENKKSKKKVLLYYLILAACLLVIAAVTVTVIFAVNRSNQSNLSSDVGQEQPDTPDNPDNPDNPDTPDDPNKPSSATNTFLMPTKSENVKTSYDLEENTTLGCFRWHTGMDFEGAEGDNVFSVLDGKVTNIVANSPSSALLDGGCVTIEHANGVTTVYKFINVKEGLKVGDSVSRGDVIGTIMAATGSEMDMGAHLHFEVKENGKYADPAKHLELIEK